MNEFFANACIGCLRVIVNGAPDLKMVQEAMKAHSEKCEKHPIYALNKRIEALSRGFVKQEKWCKEACAERDALKEEVAKLRMNLGPMASSYADKYHKLKEKVENAYSALGEHPDSDFDIAERIGQIRDEGRAHFHTVTKLQAELEKWRNWKPDDQALADAKEQAGDLSHKSTAFIYVKVLEAKVRDLRSAIKQDERERCADICARLAEIMEQGAGEIEPGSRLRQAVVMIRRAGCHEKET
jgi:uncharacterized coiled-coil DUF342 family protein